MASSGSRADGGSPEMRAASNRRRSSGTGSCSPGTRIDVLLHHGARDLQREQGVPARDGVDPHDDGTTELHVEPLAEEAADRLLAQRPDRQPSDPVIAERAVELEASRRGLRPHAEGRDDADRLDPQPAQHEGEHADGRRVEPLDVVDRDDHRLMLGDASDHGERGERDAHRSGIDTSEPDRNSAASSARCWGSGSCGRASSATCSKRSPSAAYERVASLSAALVTRTWNPAAAAASAPACHSVVFPMPALPSRTRPRAP